MNVGPSTKMNNSHTNRIIALIDMDCFYCQVEEKLDPSLRGKPIAVVQYNQWRGGGIIAVNYVARDQGVTRHMRGNEALAKCPSLKLPRVPQVRGKADLTKYREAGKEVAEVLKSFTNLLERASIDEAYLDLTEAVDTELKKGMPVISLQDLKNTFVVGGETSDFLSNIYQNRNSGLSEDDLKLAVGGVIVERIRAEVYKKTGYKCSAGIGHNKTLAKLVCSLHKPNKQTILPQQAVPEMFAKLPVRKIKSLGGKFGNTLSEMLKIEYIGELVKFSEKELIQAFDEKNGRWLYDISRGIDKEPVQNKLISKSIGCCKRFPGRTSLRKPQEVEHWIKELSDEISERLDEDLSENNRKGRLMTVSFAQGSNQSCSRAVPMKSYDLHDIYQSALQVLQKNCLKSDGTYHVTFLGISIGNFESIKNVRSITSYFGKAGKSELPGANKTIEHVLDSNLNNIKFPLGSINKNIDTLLPAKDVQKKSIQNYSQICEDNKKTSTNFCESKDIQMSPNKQINYLTNNLMNEMECNFQESDRGSNYSNSTISLDENPDDLIFYDVSHLDKNSSLLVQNKIDFEDQNNSISPLQRNTSASSIESIDSEVYSINNSPILNKTSIQGGKTSSSFFMKNFQNGVQNEPCERNFDTSKVLNDDDSTDDDNMAEMTKSNVEPFETCEECGDSIRITEIVSHMDYHLALKLSKRTSPVEKIEQKIVETAQKKKVDVAISKKRKAVDPAKNSIASFFKKEEFNTGEPTKLCSECNKNIKITDLEQHSDYHAAKRLHLELNRSNFTSGSNNNNLKSKISTKDKIDKKK